MTTATNINALADEIHRHQVLYHGADAPMMRPMTPWWLPAWQTYTNAAFQK